MKFVRNAHGVVHSVEDADAEIFAARDGWSVASAADAPANLLGRADEPDPKPRPKAKADTKE